MKIDFSLHTLLWNSLLPHCLALSPYFHIKPIFCLSFPAFCWIFMNSNLWVLSFHLAVFSRFTNAYSVVWDKLERLLDMKWEAQQKLCCLLWKAFCGQDRCQLVHTVSERQELISMLVSAILAFIFIIVYFVPYAFYWYFNIQPFPWLYFSGVFKLKK